MRYYVFNKRFLEVEEISYSNYIKMYLEHSLFNFNDESDECLLRYYSKTNTIMSESNIEGYWFHALSEGLHRCVNSSYDMAYTHFEALDLNGKLISMNYERSMCKDGNVWIYNSFHDYHPYIKETYDSDAFKYYSPIFL